VSILFAGDPHQFQPVQGVSLTKYFDRVTSSPINAVPSERDREITTGGTVWLQIKNVIVLKANFRQSDCTQLKDMLFRMRSGQLTQADCYTLDSRLLTSLPPLDPAILAKTQFIVQRNCLRLVLNDKLDKLDCAAQGKLGVMVTSEDVLAATNEPPTDQVQLWIDKHGNPAQVRQLQRRTLYYVGQSVRFTHNICPEYGLANGSLGVVVEIQLHPGQEDLQPDEHGHLHPNLPALILVKVQNLTVQVDESLDPGVVPVRPMCATGTLNVKPVNSTENITVRYTRTAFPLVPTRCITDFKSQGSGFSNVVVDLAYPEPTGRGDYGLAIYVMLSRARNLSGLRILRRFDHARLQIPFPPHVRQEWQRMQTLSDAFILEHTR
jgi:hypothetical protein